MSDDQFQASSSDAASVAERRTRSSAWLWRPWYAKLWWGSIPVYWLVIGEPTRPAILETFASSGYSAITHAVFNPIVALIVLGAGYFLRGAVSEGPEAFSPEQSRCGRLPWSPPDDFSTISGSSVNRFWRASMCEQKKK